MGSDEKETLLQKYGLSLGPKRYSAANNLPTIRIGLRKPNRWGLYDCLGNADVWLLDRFPKHVLVVNGKREWMKELGNLPYSDPAVDPLVWDEDKDAAACQLMNHLALGWGEVKRFAIVPIAEGRIFGLRVVAAPDLVAELRTRKGL